MTIGDRIREKRIEAGLSQEELAHKVGYKSRSSIQKIEAARNLPLPKVEKMAVALDCAPTYLMGWEESELEQVVMDRISDAFLRNEKAIELFALYEKADPKIQEAVELLLRSSQSDS